MEIGGVGSAPRFVRTVERDPRKERIHPGMKLVSPVLLATAEKLFAGPDLPALGSAVPRACFVGHGDPRRFTKR